MSNEEQAKYTFDNGNKDNMDLLKNESGQFGFVTRDGAFIIRSSDNRVIGGIENKNANKDVDIDDFYDNNEPEPKKKKKRPFKVNPNQVGKFIRKAGNVVSSVSSIAELFAPEYIPVLEAVKDGAVVLKGGGRVVRGSGKIVKSAKKNGSNGIQGKQVEKIVNNIPVDALTKMREMKYKGPIKKKYRAKDADMKRVITKDMMPPKIYNAPVKTMNVEKYRESMYDVF
jgi:hypothetical protein